MANNKYQFWKRFKGQPNYIQELFQEVSNNYTDKYYNIWMSKFKWTGLDEETKEQQENYIMRKLWSDGSLAIRNIANTDLIALMPFATISYNYLDFPETVNLINKRGVSEAIIPSGEQVVNKDVAIVYCLPSHKPIKQLVKYYTDRIAQVEIIINNNLKLQNIPFVIGCNEEDKDSMEDIVERILNNELVVYSAVGDINKLQTLATTAPYLIDKLKSYQVSLENELLTTLGIDNSGVQAKKAQMLVDEVNANNDAINDFGNCIIDELKSWLERANKVLNRNISIEAKTKPVDTTKDFEDASITEQKQEEEA